MESVLAFQYHVAMGKIARNFSDTCMGPFYLKELLLVEWMTSRKLPTNPKFMASFSHS